MERPGIFRVLRIAVTVLSLTVCVLLIIFWVRSHWRQDRVWGYTSATGVLEIQSILGGVAAHISSTVVAGSGMVAFALAPEPLPTVWPKLARHVS